MANIIPYDGSVEAEYADGYIHSETALHDISAYDATRNVFYDILNMLPQEEHGRMVRFSVFYLNARYDIDWRLLSDTARPVRFKQMEMDYNGPLAGQTRLMAVDFGYQYTNEEGENVQEVSRL